MKSTKLLVDLSERIFELFSVSFTHHAGNSSDQDKSRSSIMYVSRVTWGGTSAPQLQMAAW